MIPERELDFLEAIFELIHHGAEIPTPHVAAHVNAARVVFPIDDALRRRDAHICDIAQADVPMPGRVDGKLTNAGQTAARFGRAPHVHVVRLAIAEHVADFFAL